jgi:hypothetical protein
MPNVHAPWWMYMVAAVFVLALFFNAWTDIVFTGGGTGWVPADGLAGANLKVARVVPRSPMDKAGLRPGDVLEALDDHPLSEMTDWFVVRANFEFGRPMMLQVRRNEEHLRLTFVPPAWRTWHDLVPGSFFMARFITLLLAIFVAFSRPWQHSARLAALMLASAAVAEGYPAPGWAAGLRHLPAVLAIPIALATASWLLVAVAWLSFFASYPRRALDARWQWGLVLVPSIVFAPPLLASAIAMIYAPSAFVGPWPHVLHVYDLAGVAPNVFFRIWPLYQPVTEARLLELWLTVTVLYLVAGFVMLAVNYHRLQAQDERRRWGSLLLALLLLGVLTVHNVLTRNWTGWFGTVPPALFSVWGSVGERVLFLLVPLTAVYVLLTEGRADR